VRWFTFLKYGFRFCQLASNLSLVPTTIGAENNQVENKMELRNHFLGMVAVAMTIGIASPAQALLIDIEVVNATWRNVVGGGSTLSGAGTRSRVPALIKFHGAVPLTRVGATRAVIFFQTMRRFPTSLWIPRLRWENSSTTTM